MATLNLDTFNDILFGALKDTSTQGKIDMIEMELNMIAPVFLEACGEVMDDLEAEGYDSENFRKVKNIKNNSEHLLDQLEELKKIREQETNEKLI